MKLFKLGNRTLWSVLTAFFSMVLILAIAGNVVTSTWSTYINQILGIASTKIVDVGSEEIDSLYYKSDYKTYQETMKNAREVAYRTQAEGTVLMTNKNNALPLAKGAKATFFSYSTADMVFGSSGSGGVTPSSERLIDLKEACAEDGRISLNTTLYDFYKQKFDENYKTVVPSGFGGPGVKTLERQLKVGYATPEVMPSDFPQNVTASFGTYNDVGVFVLSRIGREGGDLITTSASENADKYLALSDDEKVVLQKMKELPFSKRVVLVNTMNAPELGWLDEYNIDACVYIGAPGEVGLDAVVDILVGNENPSGRLVDTYAYDSFSSPAMQNYGDFTFANASSVANPDSTKYLMYNEGIYVGYRYYETRYEDSVLNAGKASSEKGTFASASGWKYSEEVQFPFGYGLSYSTFEQTLNSVKVNEGDKEAVVSVTVKNNGTRAGKNTVQVYAQAPYKIGGVEKASVVLSGYAKTNILSAGQTQQLEIVIDLNDIASYDYEDNKTYILDSGTYYFAIGNGAHDALNNILAKKGKTVSDGMDYAGNAAKAESWVKRNFDNDEYMLSITNKKVTNQFNETDINYYAENGKDIVTYLSRSDWDATWPKNMTGFAATARMLSDISNLYDASNNPKAYTPGSSDISQYTQGADTDYKIVMMLGADYTDSHWELLLNQMTIEEMAEFSRQGRPAILSINQPATTAVDGPAAWTKVTYKEKYDDFSGSASNVTTEKMVLYPIETVIGCTWNDVLVEEIGDSFGEEGLWGGGAGWYGPGANIHRTPYSGRNFEYFSEDSFISGKMAEAEIHGAMKKGVIPYLKHFFLNDQETNRIGVSTFSNEQALREIYMRGFQYAFETDGTDSDPACSGVMSAFNRLGVTWSGHSKNLWKNVMEGEWGFTGAVTTDFGQKPQTLMDPLLAYEAGTTMFCTSGETFKKVIMEKVTSDAKLLGNLREATKRNLYNFANSLAMNGLTKTAKVVPIMTWYNATLIVIISAASVLVVVSGVFMVMHTFAKKKEERR